jgi:hypothetical protein
MGSLHYLYAETAEKGYSEFLETLSNISEFGEVEYDEKLEELKYLRNVAGLQAIVFSAMSFETAIYDFASIHLGDDYVRDHLDRLDVLSKWLVVLRFVTGTELPKNEAPYAALKSLIFQRNRLVHSKSEPFDFEDQKRQVDKFMKREKELEKNVHNSFRALVLMSLYLEKVLDGHHNPLPSYNKQNAPMRRYYNELKSVIYECRNLVAKIGHS